MKIRKPVAVLAAVGCLLLAASAVAATALDTQANEPQVAGDPTSDTTAVFPTNKQNEPSIAVNPLNSAKLIAGANDEQLQPACGPGPVRGADAPRNDCSFFPGVGTDGVYTSSDGGSTWTNRGLLPGYSEFPGQPGTLVSDGDPSIVYGPKPDGRGFSFAKGARAYYVGLASFAAGAASGNQAPELLGVSTSNDNGVHWADPVVAAQGHGFKFNDKPAVWADKNPASPFFGRVYISWTQFRGSVFTFFAEPVMVTFSDDGGKTWSPPQKLSAAHNNGRVGGRQFTAVRAGASDGTAYVAWEDSDLKGSKQVVAVSHDGGVTWSKPILIARIVDISDPIPGANFRDDSGLSLAVDSRNGAVYAAWADARSGSGRILVSKSMSHGASWSTPAAVSRARDGYAFFQGLDVAPNGRVDVAFQALKATEASTYGTGNASIDSFYVKSTNGGTTWSSPVKVSSQASDPAASAQNNLQRQFWGDYNTLVSTNANAWFVYTDSRHGVGCPAVDAYQHGFDGSGPVVDKPAPEDACASQFGNSDAFVSKITP